MARYAKAVLLALVCIGIMDIVNSYPRYHQRQYYENEDDDSREEIYQLMPVRQLRDPRSIPNDERVLVVPRRPIMMEARPSSLPEPPPRNEDRDYLYAAPSSYEPVAAETGHSNNGYDYVDYGAYTGGHGAFGWYSDHPVYVQSGGSYH